MDEKIKATNKCQICGKPTHKESKYCIFHASAEEKTEEEFKKALKEYVDKIKKEDGDYNFEKFIFVVDINFEEDLNITVFKNADFKEATFEANVDFRKATFKGATDFYKTTFEEDANFKEATFEANADPCKEAFEAFAHFSKATFEGDANFSVATFEGWVYFSDANFEGTTDFSQAIFKTNTDFSEATFKGWADFRDANFKFNPIFSKVTFKADAYFCNAIFEIQIRFSEVTFKRNTDFSGAIFKGNTYFWEATFEADANFSEATFEADADFTEATFELETVFDEAIFERNAYFKKVNFKGNAGFIEVTFKGDAVFDEAIFKADIDFSTESCVNSATFKKIRLSSRNQLNIKVENNIGIISFERALLENANINIEIVEGVLIDFTDALLRNTKIEKDKIENHILQEKEKEFSEAQEIFLLLKNNFHSIGRYRDESWAYKKEKDMERKNNCHFKSLHKWLWSCFLNAIYGYGERPERVFLSAILIVLIFACVFMNYGITSPPLDNLPKYNILKELSIGILYGDLLNKFKAIPWEQVKNYLYFSTVTFTTLGLGDFRPAESWGRIFVGSEAFIGAFMIALFVYTFARRTGGR